MPSSDRDWINIELGDGISRRGVLTQLSAAAGVGAFGSLAGCAALQRGDGQGNNQSEQSQSEGNTKGVPDYKRVELIPPPTTLNFNRKPPARDIAMVTHDASTSFFVPTVAGLHDAARQVGWKATFTGPTSGFDVQKQISILQSLVASGPDVIATSIASETSYINVIKEALSKNITVITYNTNAMSDQQMQKHFGRILPYTGQRNFEAGYVCGLAFLEQLPDDASKVTIGTAAPGQSSLKQRAKGIKLAIQKNSNIKITGVLDYTGQAATGTTKIANHIASHPNLDGIVGTDAFSWFIGKAIKNQNATKSIVGSGFDLPPKTITYIKNGAMDSTIGQDPYSQGYMPTTTSWVYLDRGMPPKDYQTGATIITSKNIDFAAKRASSWSELRKWQRNN
jgi:ABC-type sugar transport system substrate-binding protein